MARRVRSVVNDRVIGRTVVGGSSIIVLLSRDGFGRQFSAVGTVLNLASISYGGVFAVGHLRGGRKQDFFHRIFVEQKRADGICNIRRPRRYCVACAARQTRGRTLGLCGERLGYGRRRTVRTCYES